MDMDVDVVPMGEFVGDDPARYRIVGHQIFDRLVGKDDAPAEGHAFGIALEHMHLVARVAKLHRDGEIKAGGPAADACNLQARPSRSAAMLAGCRARMHQRFEIGAELARPTPRTLAESGIDAPAEAADFPKAGRLTHNFFHKLQRVGFPVELRMTRRDRAC